MTCQSRTRSHRCVQSSLDCNKDILSSAPRQQEADGLIVKFEVASRSALPDDLPEIVNVVSRVDNATQSRSIDRSGHACR